MDQLARKVHQVTMALLVPLVLQEPQVPLVNKVILEQLVPKAMTDNQGLKVRRVRLVPKALKVHRVTALLAPLVPRVTKVRKAQLVQLAQLTLARLVQLVLLVPLVLSPEKV